MARKLRTLKESVEISGVGLHTGERTTLRVHPHNAPGYLFRTPEGEVPALVEFVVEADRGTVLAREGARVLTVEHVLSALYGMGVDGAVLELKGPEPPALDGSALPLAEAIAETGLTETDREVWDYELLAPTAWEEGDRGLWAMEASDLRVSFGVHYPPPVGSGFFSLAVTPETFLKEIAPARTFIFAEDVEAVRAKGRGKGGSLENVIVYGEKGPLNPELLRFPDEPVRHKVLDLLGDLSLLGGRLKAHLFARKTGHRHHVAFVRLLRTAAARGEGFDIHSLLQLMPHRYPFLLVDRILYLDEKRVVGLKNVTINEPFFPGHFPGDPIMPGVLIIEAMAQTGGFLLLRKVENPERKLLYFAGMEGVKFKRPVRPGDQVIFDLTLVRFRGRIARMRGVARVRGEIVAEAELTASVVERPS